MTIDLSQGTYVVAVSGGVDSVSLLDMLAKSENQEVNFIVAHFDHGIRSNSENDTEFVADLATSYGFSFVTERVDLGVNSSEELARNARYDFLLRTKEKYNARAVILAHHKDDIVETMIFNILRGTGIRGLCSLKSTPLLIRPLLSKTKKEIVDYANTRNLNWIEDSTNQDTKYKRNYIRHIILPVVIKQEPDFIEELFAIYLSSITLVDEINSICAELSEKILRSDGSYNRQTFIMLPHKVAAEVLHYILIDRNILHDRVAIDRLVVAIKTGKPNKKFNVSSVNYIELTKSTWFITS